MLAKVLAKVISCLFTDRLSVVCFYCQAQAFRRELKRIVETEWEAMDYLDLAIAELEKADGLQCPEEQVLLPFDHNLIVQEIKERKLELAFNLHCTLKNVDRKTVKAQILTGSLNINFMTRDVAKAKKAALYEQIVGFGEGELKKLNDDFLEKKSAGSPFVSVLKKELDIFRRSAN